ncbi:hypothetical protein M5K25_009167 [Dendrobium thyrsiflorum]|uniref:Uncharacterized protein n=1 Tax=Dendrobium thyrsiflorum TaxID=117978 RepID=A0ABD0V5M2_DENTH
MASMFLHQLLRFDPLVIDHDPPVQPNNLHRRRFRRRRISPSPFRIEEPPKMKQLQALKLKPHEKNGKLVR